MKQQTVKLDRRIIFYSLFGLLLGIIFSKYALQINIPQMLLIVISAIMAFLGTRDEILAVAILCIPFQSYFNPPYVLLICAAVYILKFWKDLKINSSILSIILLMIWELLHCFEGVFSVITFVRLMIPYLLCGIVMWTDARKIDYAFITRCLSIGTVSVGITLIYKIAVSVNFSLNNIIYAMGRLGMGEETVEVFNGQINPNTLGIICVLAVAGLLQIYLFEKEKKTDVLMMVLLLVFGTLTVSKTFFVLAIIMVMLFVMAQRKSIKYKIRMIMGFLLILIVVIILLAMVFPDVLYLISYRFSINDITGGRIDLLNRYNEFILSDIKNILFGIGLHNFGGELLGKYDALDAVPHNGIQEIIVAWGIPGLILFSMFIIDLILSSRKVNKRQKLLNYIPLILIFAKIQAGQLITSGYTMLTLAYCYLSLCHDFYPDKNETEISIADE